MEHTMKIRWTILALAMMAIPVGIAAAQEAPAKAQPPATAEKPAAQPVIKLLEAGAEPRRELRFDVEEGAKHAAEMTMRMTMTQAMGGAAMPPQKMPAMVMTVETTASDVKDSGDIAFDFAYTKAEVLEEPGIMPMMISMMKEVMNSIVGMSGSGVMNNQGLNKSVKLNEQENMDPMLKQQTENIQQSMQQMSAPLPAEPVGVGAKWTVETPINQNGLSIKQIATYTLKKLDGDVAELDVELKQTAEEQDVEAPGMPKGAVKLTSLLSTGTGTSTVALNRLVPMASSMKSTTEMNLKMSMGPGEPQPVKQKIDLDMSLKSAGE
jgi:hypothetical protein